MSATNASPSWNCRRFSLFFFFKKTLIIPLLSPEIQGKKWNNTNFCSWNLPSGKLCLGTLATVPKWTPIISLTNALLHGKAGEERTTSVDSFPNKRMEGYHALDGTLLLICVLPARSSYLPSSTTHSDQSPLPFGDTGVHALLTTKRFTELRKWVITKSLILEQTTCEALFVPPDFWGRESL